MSARAATLTHSIDVSEEAGVRYLHFGSDWVQGAMRIVRPYALELDYTREMMLPLLWRDADWPRRVLLVGLGAGSLAKFLWKQRPEAKLTIVEIDPRMEAVARLHFRLPDDPARLRLRIACGADFVATTRQRFDLILVDGFDADARANALDTLPFYVNCRARLATEGLLCINLLSRSKRFSASLGRLKQAFDGRALAFPSCDSGNAIALATEPSDAPGPTVADLQASAKALKKATGLDLAPALARLSLSGALRGGQLPF